MSGDEKTPETALEAALWSVREERNRGREEIESLNARVAELEAAIRRIAEQDATLSVCNGNVFVEMDVVLTDAEHRAIVALRDRLRVNDAIDVELDATLRGLLERSSDGR